MGRLPVPFLVVLSFLALAAWAWPHAPWIGAASGLVGLAALPPSLRWLYRTYR